MILSELRSRYANYRFKKIRDLEISVNNEIKASNSSPERFNVNKKVQLKTLPTCYQ